MQTTSIRTRLCAASRSAFAIVLTGISLSAVAVEPLAQPQGRVVLTVTGNIMVTNTQQALDNTLINKAEFDLALLNTLPQHEFSTTTPWTTGTHHFRGVLVKDLLQRVGAQNTRVRAVALNEYHHEIDTHKPELASLLLATHLDGKPMKIRDKGPIWLMLPLSDAKQLDNKRYHELLIWQLKSLDVKYRENI